MSTSLQTMLTLLRQRTNMENNQFVTDPELTSYLNNSLCLLDGILIAQYNDYKLTSVILQPTNDHLSLPSDFLKLRGVDIIDPLTSDGYVALSQFSFKQRNQRYSVLPRHIQYRLQGSQILLSPAAIAPNYSYRLWYTPDFTRLSATTDTLPAYMDSQAWYEYAIVDSAIKVLEKQDLDTQVFERQSAMLRDHIQKLSAPNRNSGEPAAITDTRVGDRAGYGLGWNW